MMTQEYKNCWRSLGVLLTILLISACSSSPLDRENWPNIFEKSSVKKTQDMDKLTPLDESLASPEALISQANQLASPEREEILLFATKAYLDRNNINGAQSILNQLENTQLTDTLQHRKLPLIVLAHLANDRPQQAQSILDQLRAHPTEDPIYHDWLLLAQSSMASRQGHLSQAIYYLSQRQVNNNPLYEQQKNQSIWQLLKEQPLSKLNTARMDSHDQQALGWIELALINQNKNQNSTLQTQQAFNQWRLAYPSHPANNIIVPQLFLGGSNQFENNLIDKDDAIALLLPISSSYGKIAQAVRDGFISAGGAMRTRIRIYNTGANNEHIGNIYNQAINEGAKIVVGPLGKNAINMLLANTEIRRPTLLLGNANQDAQTSLSANTFQFSLSPEQEARSLASRAFQRGYSRAGILFPDSDRGERLASAFSALWQNLGGQITSTTRYYNDAFEADTTVNELIDNSVISPDLVFLASNAQQSRLLTQTLRTRYPNAAIYATSSIFSGRSDVTRDFILDKVIYCDMPWMYSDFAFADQKRRAIQFEFNSRYTPIDRYYAFGVDAYQLAQNLRQYSRQNSVSINGVTGTITLKDKQFIIQQPLLQYVNGEPVPIN